MNFQSFMRKVFLIVKEDGKRVDGLYFYKIKYCLSSKKEIIANNNSINYMLFCVERCYKNLVFLISFYFDQQIIFYDKDTIFLKPRLRKTQRVLNNF